MADFVKGLFGKQKVVAEPDDEFADFAGAPPPEPASISPVRPDTATAPESLPTFGFGQQNVAYTKWYRVWERTSIEDFYAELYVIPFMILLIGLHVWGRGTNKGKAKRWLRVHAPIIQKEYAQVGFGVKAPDADSVEAEGLANATEAESVEKEEDMLKEKSAQEYLTYATGRQNVAFSDFKITLYKRYNPATLAIEAILGYLFESVPQPVEKFDVTTYPFDGRERDLVPAKSQEQKDAIEAQGKSKNSVYDQCVFAVVNKEHMKRLRDERYDLSLTATRDHDKLPVWLAVMSENSEITDKLLTNEFIEALKSAGPDFQYLIVTDQPIDKPNTLDDTKPQKRLTLSVDLSEPFDATTSIFTYFLRLPDVLANTAHFRPEVRKTIASTREKEMKKITKAEEAEKAKDQKTEADKKKKEIRDAKMRGLSAEEQRKFLDKERERERGKQEKRSTRKVQS